jgi:two-component system, OmpR family, KDP operon response regulator KdpE
MGNDRAMADLLQAWKTSLPRPGNPALPACPEHASIARILLAEYHADLQRALRINLRAGLYDVIPARTGREALTLAASRLPDAVILDLGLPDIGGMEVLVALRRWYRPPIIAISGRTSPSDMIGALDAGADDYVARPFAMGEFLARLRAALRRDEGNVVHGQPPAAVVGRWRVDLAAHLVTRVGATDSVETLRLTPTEWAILKPLLQRPGQLVGLAQLMTGVWGPGYERRTNYLRFHMARLRGKLEDDPAHPRHLLTEYGMGYRYQP